MRDTGRAAELTTVQRKGQTEEGKLNQESSYNNYRKTHGKTATTTTIGTLVEGEEGGNDRKFRSVFTGQREGEQHRKKTRDR